MQWTQTLQKLTWKKELILGVLVEKYTGKKKNLGLKWDYYIYKKSELPILIQEIQQNLKEEIWYYRNTRTLQMLLKLPLYKSFLNVCWKKWSLESGNISQPLKTGLKIRMKVNFTSVKIWEKGSSSIFPEDESDQNKNQQNNSKSYSQNHCYCTGYHMET